MHMITLTEQQFNNYSKLHSKRNYKQTVEYANVMSKYGYTKLYLGLIDNFSNVIGATLILEKRIKGKFKIGYAPNGFLIDFNDQALLNNFTINLKEYLTKLNFIYLRISPNFAYKVFDKNNIAVKNYSSILENMKKIGYIHLGVENSFRKYGALLNTDGNIEKTYNKLNRNMKRKIKDSKSMALTCYKENNIDNFYKLVMKKNIKDIDYYRNLNKFFNTNDCKLEIFFSKINPEKYLNNCRNILEKEKDRNYYLQEQIKDLNVKKTKKLLNNKITSDKLINKYQNQVIKASNLYSKYPSEIITATCAVIRTNNTIYFIEDGYEEKLRNIYSLSILKWEIIKGYMKKGYKNFNLGNIPMLKDNKDDYYYGLYFSTSSFNPNILEYCGEFDLVMNKYIYSLLKNLHQN